jgi:CxxC-x17-CxxC domain-containing protein
MSFTEKSLQCSDCGKTFPFTAEEQEFFATKGFTNEPKRCPSCRSTCAQCGKQTEVPFQPRGDKPVYCRDCFVKSR